ncbi:MAG: TIGR03621 family F420-dependent LLM class oxidoreductase [bacterium]
MARPFRFGVSINSATSGEEWRSLAQQAEDLGYDTFLVADHIRASFQPMVALAFAAEATKRIRLGTFVINNDFRNPVLLAREAATLDLLSDGRFELGIGAGHSGDEYREAGIAFDAPNVRIDRLGESVEIMRGMWSEETVTYAGDHYRVNRHSSFPRPGQGHIPILIGGNGRRLLELAGRTADIVGLTGFLPGEDGRAKSFPNFAAEAVGSRIDIVREAAGERFADLEINVLVQGVDTLTPRETAEAWSKNVPLTAEEVLESPFTLFGSPEELQDKLLRYRDRFGISYFTVFRPAMEALAPVVRALKGD